MSGFHSLFISRLSILAVMPEMESWPAGRLLSTAARVVEHAWNEKLAGMGLSHAWVIALDVLAATGPVTQTRLARIVRVQAQTMGKTLMRLESHGHISRARSVSDRRSQAVSITDAGSAALVKARELERMVLSTDDVDTDTLRRELLALVRGLGVRDSESMANLIVAAVDEGP